MSIATIGECQRWFLLMYSYFTWTWMYMYDILKIILIFSWNESADAIQFNLPDEDPIGIKEESGSDQAVRSDANKIM